MIKFTTNLTKFGEFNIWNWPNEYKKYDMDLLGGNVDIKWTMEAETREWGIKYFVFSVNKISGGLLAEDINTNEEFEIDLDDYKWKIEENQDMISLEGSILPRELSIDFKKKTIEVEF